MNFSLEKNNIYTFKLITGEEIVAKVVSDDEGIVTVNQPIQTVVSQQGLQMVPSLFSANQEKDVTINKNSIGMIAVPREDVTTSYVEATTGISLGNQILTE